jgi:hypothetical protein
MKEDLPHWRGLSNPECVQSLRDAAYDANAFFDRIFLVDELPKQDHVPETWLNALEEALLWPDVAVDPADFLNACVDILVKHRGESELLPDAMVRLIRLAPGYKSLRSVGSYATVIGSLPPSVAVALRSTFSTLPPWRRAYLFCSPIVRHALRMADL